MVIEGMRSRMRKASSRGRRVMAWLGLGGVDGLESEGVVELDGAEVVPSACASRPEFVLGGGGTGSELKCPCKCNTSADFCKNTWLFRRIRPFRLK